MKSQFEYSKSRKVQSRVVQSRTTANRTTRRSGQTLIALLVVVLILIGLYMLYLGKRSGPNGETQPSVLKQSMNKGEDVDTTSNIMQIQQAVEMYKNDNNGKPPASLDELKNSSYGKGYPAEMWVDSVSRQPLNYDPQTGRVSSPTGGLKGAPGSAGTTVDGVDLSRVPGVGSSTGNAPPDPSSVN